MVNHKVHDGPAYWLTTVNGHEPWRAYNETANTETMFCDTCGWVGQSFKGRWRDKAEATWRIHAGDIAMGLELMHGRHDDVNQRCFCATCQMARRARMACAAEGHDLSATPELGEPQRCARYLCGAEIEAGEAAAVAREKTAKGPAR
jgi:hypothetical protein